MEAEGVSMNDREIGERIALIESMMCEGRKSTRYWGWTFFLWGIAYFVAVGWSNFLPQAGGRQLGWPVTMIFAVLLTLAIARKRNRHEPLTQISRSIQMVWMAVGFGIFVFAFPTAYSGHFEVHSFMAAIEVLLGVVNVASGAMLRWSTQIVVGALWWTAAIASCFVSSPGVAIVFLAATLVCNIGFGIYLMVLEGRDKARARAAQVQHA